MEDFQFQLVCLKEARIHWCQQQFDVAAAVVVMTL